MPTTVDQALEMAEQALEDGEFEDTVALADKALELSPNDPDALHLKGLALGSLGEFEAADEALAAVLAQEPHNVTLLLDAADVKIRELGDDRERIEEGLDLLKRAERHARNDEAAAIQLELLRGIAMNQLGEFEAALDSFARDIDLLSRAIGIALAVDFDAAPANVRAHSAADGARREDSAQHGDQRAEPSRTPPVDAHSH